MIAYNVAFAVATGTVMAPGDAVPAGWTAMAGADGVATYTPDDLKPGEELTIAIYPEQKIGDDGVGTWLMGYAQKDGDGEVPVMQNQNATVAAVIRMFPAPDGSRHARVYTAKKVNGAVRLVRVTMSSEGNIYSRHKAEINAIIKDATNPGGAVARSAPSKPEPTPETATTGDSTKRPQFVTAPGKGVPASQVAAILHEYDVELYSAGTSGMGTNVTDNAYLLLKDGTVHKGLVVPPDSFDIAASRKGDPKAWGRWRKAGTGYEAAFGGGAFQKLNAHPVIPMPDGAKLAGRYGTGSSSASLAGSSYSLWGITFTAGGHFKKDGRGGSGNSLFLQNGGAPAINSTYNDNGSVTTATTANSTVMAKKGNNPNGDKEGMYSIAGGVMTLRYDNGVVERVPFFYTQTNRKTIYFEGNQLALDDDKN